MDNQNYKKEIISRDINDEMRQSYIDYAMSVIVSRALPDVRDGLKPVHRRILYAMHEGGYTHEKKSRKCARIIGDVMGKYHPHGDAALYGALVRMAQPFSMRQMLISGQGNFGSIDGDNAAAMRYTEAKLARLSGELLRDINKKTVDFQPNFDGEEQEPTVLPARFPNLLVNGSNGIAVGMATSIPPHNLGEVIDATVAMIKNPEIEVDELVNYIKAPDFPTGASIMGVSGFLRAYKTGKGKVILRSKYELEEKKNGKTNIVFTEIPYQVNKAKMLESIAKLVRDKKIDGITALRDESNRNGIRIVFEIRKDAMPEIVVNQLFKHSQLQSTIGMNMIALVDGVPKVLNLKQILEHYIKHQIEVETRRVQFDLEKAEARAHILEGYLIALDNIDEVIKIIRSAYDDAEEKLMKRYQLSEIQAKAIVDMRLRRLQGLEREKLENEYKNLQEFISECKAILADENLLLDIIINYLEEIKNRYNDERRSTIEFNYNEIDIEDMIADEQVTVTITSQGYIKRVPIDIYQAQNRGGRGKTGLSTREEDYVVDLFTTNTHDYLLFFTDKGKVYRIKTYQIPEGSRLSKGVAIINLIALSPDEKISAVVPISTFEDGYLLMATKKGVVKRTEISAYDSSRSPGLIALNLRDDDELVGVKKVFKDDIVILVTRLGKAIMFKSTDARAMGRIATGVKGINLAKGDYVVSLAKHQENAALLVVSENGYGKRTMLSEYNVQKRGGKGIITYNTKEKTGNLIGAMVVDGTEDVILINSKAVIIRIRVSEISIYNRYTSGVKVMKIEDESKLIAIAKIIEEEKEEDNIEETEK